MRFSHEFSVKYVCQVAPRERPEVISQTDVFTPQMICETLGLWHSATEITQRDALIFTDFTAFAIVSSGASVLVLTTAAAAVAC